MKFGNVDSMSSDIFTILGFHPIVEQWFKTQFAAPSPPQRRGWPSIAKGEHTLILAPTGSGKTLAAFLWSIDKLFREAIKTDSQGFSKNTIGVHTLYISPLKALNNDIHRNLQAPLQQIRRQARKEGIPIPEIRVAVRTGDTPPHVRQSMLRKPPHILITTPESFYLMLTSTRGRELFRHVQFVIVDEIHALCTNKRGVHLSLSLERMLPLCKSQPVRIGLSATQKPLQRIAAYLGGRQFTPRRRSATARPVNIVDCGQRKHLDLKVVTPVSSFDDLPDVSVWEPVYQKLYEWIRAHKTTLVFASMRAQTEKIARRLNEIHRQMTDDPGAELALAHHGSISREIRYEIEARLKAGKIPAVIATATLELGIDIGSIDLVVHLEAPRSVSSAMQRVGRSGHLISATSKGRILVLYPSDLDDAVTMARCMHHADIEAARIPENALDVLAQHIVAEIAVKNWDFTKLFRLIQQSYCYRTLSPSNFKHVIEMLSGRFADSPLQALKARISWDKVNNRLIARRGSRMVAVLNSGTIPDRGYFGVYLKDSNIRLGEVEEEFVFESRVGETFFLGNSEWRIDSIMQSRIIVTPVAAIKPKAPFWMGDTLYRDYATSKKIGRFRQKLLEHIDRGTAENWLNATYYADRRTAENLVRYFQRQRESIDTIPTDTQFVVESTTNADGQPVFFLHAPLGARVNGAWAVALAAALERQWQTTAQYSFDDDGLMVRLPDTTEKPPLEKLFKLSPAEIEENLISALPANPIFAVQFRYNAARSLLLPRSQPKKRIPLWLQRLRAADLLQVVQQYPDFPVISETFRECLQDVFDLPILKKVIQHLNAGRIRIRFAQPSCPSPMAANIMFKFVATYLYELDKTRQPRNVAGSSQFLTEILDHAQIPAVVTPGLIRQAEMRWQHLAPEHKATSAEDLFDIIEKLGPMDVSQLAKRSRQDPKPWIAELASSRRIENIASKENDPGTEYWTVSSTEQQTHLAHKAPGNRRRILRYLSSRGPVDADRIQTDLKLSPSSVDKALQTLYRQKKVVHGQLTMGLDKTQWCDRQNFMQLYRMAIAWRRSVQAPATRKTFNRFLFEWHRINKPEQSLMECFQRYRGLRFPLQFFERNVLFSRFHQPGQAMWTEALAEIEGLISNGEIIVLSSKDNDTARRYLQFRLRGDGSIFSDPDTLCAALENVSTAAKTAFDFLNENGASYVRDVEMGTGLSRLQLQGALRELADQGLASCENYESFLMVLQSADGGDPIQTQRTEKYALNPYPNHRRPMRPSAVRKIVQEQTRMQNGRWFLTTSFAIMGKLLTESDRTTTQARLLLQRYGILVKEFYRHEKGLLPWYRIFQSLKRLEWQGEIRRGYFVEGLSGVQFAMPEALELLEKIHHQRFETDPRPLLLSCVDPALPYGGTLQWQLTGRAGYRSKIVRSPLNHLVFLNGDVVLYCESFFQRLSIFNDLPPMFWDSMKRILQDHIKMPHHLKLKNRIEIQQINGEPAGASLFSDELRKAGFEKDGNKLVLWPSTI